MFNAAALADAFQKGMIAHQHQMAESQPLVLISLAKHGRDAQDITRVPSNLKVSEIHELQKQGIVYLKHGHYRLSKRGQALALELAKTMPRRQSFVLQEAIRSIRSIELPRVNPFWFRNVMWRLRTWWEGTTPEPRPVIDMGELKPYVTWTEQDEADQRQQWLDGNLSAFWLCPSGVTAGLEWIRKRDAAGEGICDAARAVAESARLMKALVKPKLALVSVVAYGAGGSGPGGPPVVTGGGYDRLIDRLDAQIAAASMFGSGKNEDCSVGHRPMMFAAIQEFDDVFFQ